MSKDKRPPVQTPRPSRANANTSHDRADPWDAGDILDFLYYDATRVGAILTQLRDEGVPTSVSESDQREHTTTTDLHGGISTLLSIGAQRADAEIDGYVLARTLDPYWHLPRLLLQELKDRGLLGRTLKNAKIGQITEIIGDIEIADSTSFGMLMEKMFAEAGGIASEPEERLGAMMFSQFTKMFPRATMGRVKSKNDEAWLNVATGALVMPSSQIMLGHGGNMQGKWTVVGIVDACPDPLGGLAGSSSNTNADDTNDQQLFDNVQGINTIVRAFAGRQAHQFGITPLLIYRRIW